ncbi:MAG: hypothetical protein IJ071_07250 [Ruminococcus sp.]|nr:hypothetical protein [Ruminococcus sp.]
MGARFHLPDFFWQFQFNMVFANMLENCPQFFRDGVGIASFYGTFPECVWNGGRTVHGIYRDDVAQRIIKAFNSKSIPLRFTFTNPVLTEEELSDPICNRVMQIAGNGLNEVIVNSPLLEDYIRRTYPDYKITSSTCRMITDEQKLREELEKDYHILVLDYNFNNKFDVLERLPHKEMIEVLVNSCCDPGCPNRKRHYELMGKEMIAYRDYRRSMDPAQFDMDKYDTDNEHNSIKCRARARSIFEIFKLSTCVTPEALWERYVPMGFEQFKIEGRTASLIYLVEVYMQYMVKPEFRDEARMIFMVNLQRNGVVKL